MNIIIRDCVKCIQSGIDGSEYRYLGTGFNTQTQVRSSTSTLFSHVDLHVPGDSIVARPVTRILGTLRVSPSGFQELLVSCGPHFVNFPRRERLRPVFPKIP